MHKHFSGAVWNYGSSFYVFISGFDSHSRRQLIACLIAGYLLGASSLHAEELTQQFFCSGLVVQRESGDVQKILLDDMVLHIGLQDTHALLTSNSNIQPSPIFPMQSGLANLSSYKDRSNSKEWSFRHELRNKNKSNTRLSTLRIDRLTGKLTLRSVMQSGATLGIDGRCQLIGQ